MKWEQKSGEKTMPEMRNGAIEPEAVEIVPSGMLSSISKDEIEMQISTAHKFPRFTSNRGVEQFQADILYLATVDEDTARACFYRLERRGRDGKVIIEGPSVRMAEIVASCWRNLHLMGRVAAIDQDFVVGQAMAWDLESNLKIGMETRRRIVDRNGRRYSDDMIMTTANAAVAVAFRNAVFKVIPGALIKRAMAEAKAVSVGKGMTMDQRLERAFKLMASVGAKPDQVLRVLERKSMKDVTVEDLIALNGFYTAIKDNETSWVTILEDFEKSQPRSEEDIRKSFGTGFDQVDLAEDRQKAPTPEPAKATPTASTPSTGQPASSAETRKKVTRDAAAKLEQECRVKGLKGVEIFDRLAGAFGDEHSDVYDLYEDELPAARTALGV